MDCYYDHKNDPWDYSCSNCKEMFIQPENAITKCHCWTTERCDCGSNECYSCCGTWCEGCVEKIHKNDDDHICTQLLKKKNEVLEGRLDDLEELVESLRRELQTLKQKII